LPNVLTVPIQWASQTVFAQFVVLIQLDSILLKCSFSNSTEKAEGDYSIEQYKDKINALESKLNVVTNERNQIKSELKEQLKKAADEKNVGETEMADLESKLRAMATEMGHLRSKDDHLTRQVQLLTDERDNLLE